MPGRRPRGALSNFSPHRSATRTLARLTGAPCCDHTFRGTGITAYLENPDAKLEHAQQMAAHADPKTTRLYDRRSDEVTLDEVERIGI
jgi:integrase